MSNVLEVGLGIGTQLERNGILLENVTEENWYTPEVVEAVSKVRYLTGTPGNPHYECRLATWKQLRYIASLAGMGYLGTAQLEFLAHVYGVDLGQAGCMINKLKK